MDESVSGFDSVVAIDRLEEVLKDADVVVIGLPLTVKTFHLIDEKKLRAMKPTCILINVARGCIVEEKALYDYLKNTPSFKCGGRTVALSEKGRSLCTKVPLFGVAQLPRNSSRFRDSSGTEEIALLSAIENIGRFVRGGVLKGVMNRNDYLGLKELIAQAN